MNIFLIGLLLSSTLTGLVTEAIKNICTEHGRGYHANTLAGIVATLMSVSLSLGYVLYCGTAVSTQIIVSAIALVFLSWLCAMVGYDKVIQALSQFGNGGD